MYTEHGTEEEHVKTPMITVEFNKTDYKWHARCDKCDASVASAHTADAPRLTNLVQGALKHVAEVHGA